LNEIRKLINVEQKYIDVSSNTAGIDYNGATTYLCPVAQGDDVTNREGNSIKVQKFQIRGTVVASSTAAQAARIMVIRDLQNQGAAPTVGSILQTIGAGQAPFQQLDFTNWQNKQFTVVFDQLFTLDQYNPMDMFEFETNHDCHVYFRGTGSTSASAGNGAYYAVYISSESTSGPIFSLATRLLFTDN